MVDSESASFIAYQLSCAILLLILMIEELFSDPAV
jgi:hypothetical protein